MASKNISFDTIPASIRKPGKYGEFNLRLAVRTLPANKQRMLIVGQRLAAGSVAEKVPTLAFSDAHAADYFGQGSVAHLMTRAAIVANPYLDLTIVALDDAATGVAALGSTKINGPATSSGSNTVFIANRKIEVGVVSGDTAASMATTLNTELAKYPDLPVTAEVDGVDTAKVNFTAKNKGTLGNQIGITFSSTATGVTSTIVAMNGGAVDPDIAAALATVFAEQYHVVATPYNDETSITALRTHLFSVSGSLEKRPGIGFYGNTGALAATTTLSGLINDGRIYAPYLRGTRSLPYELAAAFSSVVAFEEDPAMPLNTLELKGIHAPAIDQRLSRTEQENCLYNGVTPLEVGPGERVQIVRAVSTYVQDAQGVDDISLLDITTIRSLDYSRKAWLDRISLRFPRSKKTTRVKDAIRTELLDVSYKLEELEILENVDEHKAKLLVEDDLQDPNRVNAAIPADVVNGLHVFAARIDLYL